MINDNACYIYITQRSKQCPKKKKSKWMMLDDAATGIMLWLIFKTTTKQ